MRRIKLDEAATVATRSQVDTEYKLRMLSFLGVFANARL
jgi:hypothetical protein